MKKYSEFVIFEKKSEEIGSEELLNLNTDIQNLASILTKKYSNSALTKYTSKTADDSPIKKGEDYYCFFNVVENVSSSVENEYEEDMLNEENEVSGNTSTQISNNKNQRNTQNIGNQKQEDGKDVKNTKKPVTKTLPKALCKITVTGIENTKKLITKYEIKASSRENPVTDKTKYHRDSIPFASLVKDPKNYIMLLSSEEKSTYARLNTNF